MMMSSHFGRQTVIVANHQLKPGAPDFLWEAANLARRCCAPNYRGYGDADLFDGWLGWKAYLSHSLSVHSHFDEFNQLDPSISQFVRALQALLKGGSGLYSLLPKSQGDPTLRTTSWLILSSASEEAWRRWRKLATQIHQPRKLAETAVVRRPCTAWRLSTVRFEADAKGSHCCDFKRFMVGKSLTIRVESKCS